MTEEPLAYKEMYQGNKEKHTSKLSITYSPISCLSIFREIFIDSPNFRSYSQMFSPISRVFP